MQQPWGSLIQSPGGKLYGLTSQGGVNNAGVIFSIDPLGSSYLATNLANTNGRRPEGGLVKTNDGKLYGITSQGGATQRGVIYSFDPATGLFSKPFDFSDANGTNPSAALILASDGKLYGTTQYGGTGRFGVIFSWDPATSTYARLKDFDFTNGVEPFGGLLLASNGKLYGLASRGGNGDNGVIYSFDPSTSIFTNVRTFTYTDGATPFGKLIEARNGLLYGMTLRGGANEAGVMFSFNTATGGYTVMRDFGGVDGGSPFGSLVQAGDGKLYGLTQNGGIASAGAIFSFDPASSTFTPLTEFSGPDGFQPRGTLFQASNGLLYGTTFEGGSNNAGVIFSYDPVGLSFTKLKDFDGIDGANPDIGNQFIEITGCITPSNYCQDSDADGFGNRNMKVSRCEQPAGYVSDSTDCDDSNNAIHGPSKYYRDADIDGFGDPTDSTMACTQPVGYVINNTDCNDSDKRSQTATTYYLDADHDGLGDADVSISVCGRAPRGYVRNNFDCDDHTRNHGRVCTIDLIVKSL